jgi:alpha-galactosidase
MTSIEIRGLRIELFVERDGTEAAAEVSLSVWDEPGYSLLTAEISPGSKGDSLRFRAVVEVPICDYHAVWTHSRSQTTLREIAWGYHVPSCANIGMPALGFVTRDGTAKHFFGWLDQITETTLDLKVIEDSLPGPVYRGIFSKPLPKSRLHDGRWTEQLYVSSRGAPWPVEVAGYVNVHDELTGFEQPEIPEGAYDPVFCSWYAIHHDLTQGWLLRNAAKARELGFKTVIVDDGWYYDGPGVWGEFPRAGHWSPSAEKFPDLGAMVKSLHDIGVKVMLWTSPFMLGIRSKAWDRLKGFALGPEQMRARMLCPRCPEPRADAVESMKDLITRYDIDGLKLDFIDWVDLSPCQGEHEHDCETAGEGLLRFYDLIESELKGLKPDLLIEFRVRYANLVGRRVATAFRADDAPCDFDANRARIVNIRSFSGSVPAHFDPAFWHPDETDENVARHMINSIFCVPTVSVDLEKAAQSHLDIVKNWIGFYNSHRDALAKSNLDADLWFGTFPMLKVTECDVSILGLFGSGKEVYTLPPSRQVFVLNATQSDQVRLECPTVAGGRVVGARGEELGPRHLIGGLNGVDIPVGGRLEVTIGGPGFRTPVP